jgi:hypothetical protein
MSFDGSRVRRLSCMLAEHQGEFDMLESKRRQLVQNVIIFVYLLIVRQNYGYKITFRVFISSDNRSVVVHLSIFPIPPT